MCKIKDFTILYIVFIFVFILVNINVYQIDTIYEISVKNNTNNEEIIETSRQEKKEYLLISEELQVNNVKEIYEWKIIIPKINLEASIKEGISQEIIAKAVGHFEESSLLKGNVALAAHNRGYRMNFFENIKNLNIGDELIYKINNIENTYKIIIKEIIEDTNWKYINNTIDNRLTLITCVENQPDNRLCIQAIQI